MNEEFLGFVAEIGRTTDRKYMYRFDFTYDPDSLWGEFFNIPPACIIPDLAPDPNCLSHTAKIVSPVKLMTAKENACFSMQDCIDGIIPLCFAEICDNTLTVDDVPFFLRFGETYENVVKTLGLLNIKLYDEEKIVVDDREPINNLIKKLDEENNDFDDLDF